MFTIRMDENKNLYAISPRQIIQGEYSVDALQFLVPDTYGNVSISDCEVYLCYVDAKGVSSDIVMSAKPSGYDNTLSFVCPITKEFTATINKLAFWLQVEKDGQLVLKSAPIFIPILPAESVIDVPPDRIPEMFEMWLQQMSALYKQTLSIQTSGADNIQEVQPGMIQLQANNKPLGNIVEINMYWKEL